MAEVITVPLPELIKWLKELEKHHKEEGRPQVAIGVRSAIVKIRQLKTDKL